MYCCFCLYVHSAIRYVQRRVVNICALEAAIFCRLIKFAESTVMCPLLFRNGTIKRNTWKLWDQFNVIKSI